MTVDEILTELETWPFVEYDANKADTLAAEVRRLRTELIYFSKAKALRRGQPLPEAPNG